MRTSIINFYKLLFQDLGTLMTLNYERQDAMPITKYGVLKTNRETREVLREPNVNVFNGCMT